MHQQLQICPGVYITDFRTNNVKLVGLSEPKNELTNDVGLLLDTIKSSENKIKMLQFSIKEIQSEDNWEGDADFTEAIEDNWAAIIRLTCDMKQKILRLFQLKFHPDTDQIQQLLNIDRVERRESIAQKQLNQILSKRQQFIISEAIQEESSDQEQQDIQMQIQAKLQHSIQKQKETQKEEKEPKEEKQKEKEKEEEKEKEKEEGIYL